MDKYNKKTWKSFTLPAKIAAMFVAIILTGGVVIATTYIVKDIVKLDKMSHLNDAVENGYIQNIDMDYIQQDGIEFKIDYLLMDDTNFDLVFNFKFDGDVSNYEGVSIPELIITDEQNNQIFFDTESEEHYKSYAKSMGYNTIEKTGNTIRQLLFLKSNKFPKSKKIYVSFKTVILYNVSQGNPFTKELNGDWKLEFDVDKQFTDRTNINYEVKKSDAGDKVEIQVAELTNTGFNISLKSSIMKEIESIELEGKNGEKYELVDSILIEDLEKYSEASSQALKIVGHPEIPSENFTGEAVVVSDSSYWEKLNKEIDKILYPDGMREVLITFNMTKYNGKDSVKLILTEKNGDKISIVLEKK